MQAHACTHRTPHMYQLSYSAGQNPPIHLLLTNLVAQFYPVETRTARTIEFQSTRYNFGETINSYAFSLERNSNRLCPSLLPPVLH